MALTKEHVLLAIIHSAHVVGDLIALRERIMNLGRRIQAMHVLGSDHWRR